MKCLKKYVYGIGVFIGLFLPHVGAAELILVGTPEGKEPKLFIKNDSFVYKQRMQPRFVFVPPDAQAFVEPHDFSQGSYENRLAGCLSMHSHIIDTNQRYKEILKRVPDPVVQERIRRRMAITEDCRNFVRSAVHRYHITPEAKNMLAQWGCNVPEIEMLQGNAIQHMVHEEFVLCANTIANIFDECEIAPLIGEHMRLGMHANKENRIDLALAASDVCYFLADVALGIASGYIKGYKNVIMSVAHPLNTAGNIAYGLCLAMHGLRIIGPEIERMNWELLCGDPEGMRKLQTCVNATGAFLTNVWGVMKEAGTKEVTTEVMAFITEWGLMGKICGEIGAIVAEGAEAAGSAARSEQIIGATASVCRTFQDQEFITLACEIEKGSEALCALSTIVKNPITRAVVDIAEYDASIGNLKNLARAVQLADKLPGASVSNGALTVALKCGKKGNEVERLSTARGALYELEKALEVLDKENNIVAIGQKIQNREFDIVTTTKLIECKDISWVFKNAKDILDKQSIFRNQQKIALDLGKQFEVHSKRPIPDLWKQFFKERNIKFYEG